MRVGPRVLLVAVINCRQVEVGEGKIVITLISLPLPLTLLLPASPRYSQIPSQARHSMSMPTPLLSSLWLPPTPLSFLSLTLTHCHHYWQ